MATRRQDQVDLFAWRELSEIEGKRTELIARIQKHRPNSHARVELIARLKQLTTEAIQMETRQ